MKLKPYWILLTIIILGFIVRLYRINNPIADWHSWRQADTSAVSRNFIKHGFDVLHPTYDDISNVQSGLDNPKGYRFVEFPIFNIFQAGLYKVFGVLTLEEWGRLVTIISTLFSTLLIYLLVKRHSSIREGLLAAFFFAFIPYSIYYGRTILPDEMMVTASLAGIYFFDRWIEKFEISNPKSETSLKSKKQKKEVMLNSFQHPMGSQNKFWMRVDFGLSLFFTACAFLLKPYALFFTLPMIYLAFRAFGLSIFKKWQLWIFLIISVIPLTAWRLWMTQYPEGIPASNWLFNGNGIRFRPAFFRWILFERLTKLILGYFGVVFLLLGLLKKKVEKDYFFPFIFLLSSIIYVCVIATGNVQHDYYQILIIPSLCMLLARGSIYLLEITLVPKVITKIILIIVVFCSFYFAWNGVHINNTVGLPATLSVSTGGVKDYFNINNPAIVEAGRAVDILTPKNALVIAPYDGDTSFLYQTNRKGWPSFEHSLQDLIHMGASYYVLVHPSASDVKSLKSQYKIISETNDYILVKLK